MKTAKVFKLILKPTRAVISVACLLTLPTVAAKSEAPSHPVSKSADLILDLPYELEKSSPSSFQSTTNSIISKQNRDTNQTLLSTTKKHTPVNVDCGMDVTQNTAPDVPLTSRLTGECDLKYHY